MLVLVFSWDLSTLRKKYRISPGLSLKGGFDFLLTNHWYLIDIVLIKKQQHMTFFRLLKQAFSRGFQKQIDSLMLLKAPEKATQIY